MDERKIVVLGAVTLILVGIILVISMQRKEPLAPAISSGRTAPVPDQPAPPVEQPSAPQAPRASCGRVTLSCVAKVSLKDRACEKEPAKVKASQRLANPLRLQPCIGIEERLAKQCPPDCQFDYSSLLVIPGRPDVTFLGKRGVETSCTVTGERHVTVSGACRPS